MSPLGYLTAFTLGFGVAGGVGWLVVRAIDRGWWPWLDAMNDNTVIKVLVIGCAVLGSAWIAVFAAFLVLRASQT